MITREEILKIAALSRLSVSDEELEALMTDMTQIIEFANAIHAVPEDSETFEPALSNVFRADEVVPSFPREAILQNIDGGEDGYFPVKHQM